MKGRRRLILGNISKVKCILTHRAKQATQDHTNPSTCKAMQGQIGRGTIKYFHYIIFLNYLQYFCSIWNIFVLWWFKSIFILFRAVCSIWSSFVLFGTVSFYLKQFCFIWNSFALSGTVLLDLEQFCSILKSFVHFFSIWNSFVHFVHLFYMRIFLFYNKELPGRGNSLFHIHVVHIGCQ